MTDELKKHMTEHIQKKYGVLSPALISAILAAIEQLLPAVISIITSLVPATPTPVATPPAAAKKA